MNAENTGEPVRDPRIIPPIDGGLEDMALADGDVRPEDVKAARAASGLTQLEAAPLVYTSVDNWQNWEQGRNNMAPAVLELFLLKTGQFTLREFIPGAVRTVMRLRLRTGRIVEMSLKHVQAREIEGFASAE
jgi:putative transcriptional regulator